MTKVVVFDLDDTLYPEHEYVRSGFRAVDVYLEKMGVSGFFGEAWSHFCDGGRGSTFDVCLGRLGIDVEPSLVGRLVSEYREHEPKISSYEDAERALSRLDGDYHLGLITDGASESQHQKIKALSLDPRFGKIVVTDDLGSNRTCWKPHPLAYQVVREHFMVPHSECLYVGDNQTKDFVAARKLGWKTICIVRPGGEYSGAEVDRSYRADRNILSLDDLVVT